MSLAEHCKEQGYNSLQQPFIPPIKDRHKFEQILSGKTTWFALLILLDKAKIFQDSVLIFSC